MRLARAALTHRLLTAALLAAAIVGVWVGWLWLRDISLLRVKHVEIEGAHGSEAAAIKRALRQTAMRMTLLHVSEDELEQSVDAFPVVRSVSASIDLPTTLRIKVEAHEPVAVLVSGERRVAVSQSGIMLRGIGPRARLPEVKVPSLPDSRELEAGTARALVGVLGGAPKPLRPYLARAYATRKGARIAVRHGPVIEFGRPQRIAAKWAAATRVLADPGSSGAEVIDVRLPERPAARGEGVAQEPPGDTATDAAAAPVAAAATAAQAPQVGGTVGGAVGQAQGTPPPVEQPAATGPTTGPGSYSQP